MNRYYFKIARWNAPRTYDYKPDPIRAESYTNALAELYKDTRIIGATLVALQDWGGNWHRGERALYSPGIYDVPSLIV
jgi:hypothetical protein